MNVTYKSGIGQGTWWMLIIAVVHIPLIIVLTNLELWETAIATFALSIIILALIYYNVYYQISYDGELRIKATLLSETIKVSHIHCIRRHRSYRNHPYAVSAKRLIIHFAPRRSVEISPQDREAFITDLLTMNPSIEVKKEETYS